MPKHANPDDLQIDFNRTIKSFAQEACIIKCKYHGPANKNSKLKILPGKNYNVVVLRKKNPDDPITIIVMAGGKYRLLFYASGTLLASHWGADILNALFA